MHFLGKIGYLLQYMSFSIMMNSYIQILTVFFCSGSSKLNILPPPLFQTSVAAYLAKLREVTALRVQMVMVVVSNKNDAVLYQTIKTHTKCECPTISQVVTLTVLRKPKGEGFEVLFQLICLRFYFPFF